MFDENKPLSEIECYRVAERPIKVRIAHKIGKTKCHSQLFDIENATYELTALNFSHGYDKYWLEWEV